MTQIVYDPAISIVVHKVSSRKNVAEGIKANKRVDSNKRFQLDQYMGEGCSCRITKSVSQPAGTFDIMITDMMGTDFESVYGEIEPMDVVEIRMAHSPDGLGEKLPIMMRGFVSEVRRSEGVGEGGEPQKMIQISGHDYGKLFQMVRVIRNGYASGIVPDISGFDYAHIMGAEFGVADEDNYVNIQVNSFIKDHIVQAVQKGFLDKVPWGDDKTRPFKKLTALGTAKGTVAYYNIQAIQDNASLWDYVSQCCDISNGFNEFFTVDRKDDVAVVIRTKPYIRPNGKLIPPSDEEKDWFPEAVTVTDSDIMSINSSRSDAKIANFFQCRIKSYELQNDQEIETQAPPELVKGNQNCAKERYGVRQLTVQCKLLSDAGPDDYDQNEEWRKWHLDIMKQISTDAVLFESGNIRLKGNEKIKAGGYLTVKRNNMTYKVYVESVDHDFQMYGGFFTNVRYTNGTAFIQRLQKEKPYLDEMGVVDAYGK